MAAKQRREKKWKEMKEERNFFLCVSLKANIFMLKWWKIRLNIKWLFFHPLFISLQKNGNKMSQKHHRKKFTKNQKFFSWNLTRERWKISENLEIIIGVFLFHDKLFLSFLCQQKFEISKNISHSKNDKNVVCWLSNQFLFQKTEKEIQNVYKNHWNNLSQVGWEDIRAD